MALPRFLQPYLASYDLKKINKNAPEVRRELINQILNSGDDRATNWLFKSYSQKTIKSALRQPIRGTWFKDSLNYWVKILGIKIPSQAARKAIFELGR